MSINSKIPFSDPTLQSLIHIYQTWYIMRLSLSFASATAPFHPTKSSKSIQHQGTDHRSESSAYEAEMASCHIHAFVSGSWE